MSYCGTCKTDPCLVDSNVICCHQAVRYGYCSGHLDVSASKDYKAFEAMMDAEIEQRVAAQERRITYNPPGHLTTPQKP